jgi:hypothetical protein
MRLDNRCLVDFTSDCAIFPKPLSNFKVTHKLSYRCTISKAPVLGVFNEIEDMHDRSQARKKFRSSMQSAKKRRDNTYADIVELDAREVIRFRFNGTKEGYHPEYVHQNFGESGKIEWPREMLPLVVTVDVDTFNDLSCSLSIEHGGDPSSETAKVRTAEIVGQMVRPCDLGNGCKPAVYPGEMVASSAHQTGKNTIQPDAIDQIEGGYIVTRFQSKNFNGKILDLWRRAEWLMLWFIESVSQSPHEVDPNWEYVFLRDDRGNIISFSSLYRFPSFSFLQKGFIGDRVRISQFLTLPCYWNSGLGSVLLGHLAENIRSRDDVDKLTMEDPSFGMTSLRESVYLRILKTIGMLDKIVSTDDLVETLKVPRSFARRIRNLVGIARLLRTVPDGVDPVTALMTSRNKFVQAFIDSIEFYDDQDENEEVQAPLSAQDTDALVRDRLAASIRKISKIAG